MSTRVGPSANAWGIHLTSPVVVRHQGLLVMLARAAGTATDELFLRVLDPSATLDAPDEAAWNGWYRFRFPEAPPDPAEPVTVGAAPATRPELRVGGMDLLTVVPTVASVSPADAAFHVVSDDAYLWCFRPSTTGTLYLSRLAVVSHRQTVGETEEVRYGLEQAGEVRFQRSGLRSVPLDDTDSSSAVDLTGTPFAEPTVELTGITGAATGRFGVARVPTATAGTVAWYVAVTTAGGVLLTRFDQTDEAFVDTGSGGGALTVVPSRYVDGGPTAPLTVSTDVAPALAFYAEHDAMPAGGGDVDLPRQGRLLLVATVSGEGLGSATAVYDFAVGAQGQISALTSAQQALRLVDGTLTAGVFTPDLVEPHYPAARDAAACVQVVDGLVVNQMLLGQVAPGTEPAVDMLLRPGDDGLVHLYYGGPATSTQEAEITGWHALVPGQPQALVAQLDPRVSRLVLDLPWAQLGPSEQQAGALHLAGRAAGAIMAGTTVTVSASTFSTANPADQVDLCDLAVTYPAASMLRSETWVGLPRETTALVAVVNGRATDDSADPAVLGGGRMFFDFAGDSPQLRLPLATGVPAGSAHTDYAVLTSSRSGLPLRHGSVVLGGTEARLELHFGFGTDGDLVQVWGGLPRDLEDVVAVLDGGASPTIYGYEPAAASTPLFALATEGSSVLAPVLLVPTSAAPSDVGSMTVEVTVSAAVPSLLDVTFAGIESGGGTVEQVHRDAATFVADLRAAPLVTTLGLHVDGTGASGTVAPTRVPLPAVDLRDGACLFDVRRPAELPGGTTLAGASSLVAGTQRHTFAADPAPVPPSPSSPTPSPDESVGLVASADVPDDGAPAYVVDTKQQSVRSRASRVLGDVATGGDQPRSGVWLRESPPNAITFDGTDNVTVPLVENGRPLPRSARLRPSAHWTLESWLQPTGSEPRRLVTFADTLTDVLPDAPALDYRVALEGQKVLRIGSYDHQPGVPDSSYAQGAVAVGENPLPPEAFTWEFWVRPEEAAAPTQGMGGVVAVEVPGLGSPGLAIGLQRDRHVVVRTCDDMNRTTSFVSQDALPFLDDDAEPQWSHVALRGSYDGSTRAWTLQLVVNAVVDSTFDAVVLPTGHDGATVVIGSNDPADSSVFGQVAQLRLWSTDRSVAEIRRSAFVALAGTEPGLLGCWPLTAIEDRKKAGEPGEDHRFLVNKATRTGEAWDALVVTGKQSFDTADDDFFLSVVASVGGLPAVKADALLATGRWNHLAVTFEAGGALELNPATRTDVGAVDWMTCAHSDSLVAGSAFSVDAWLRLPPTHRLDGTIAARWAWDADPQDQSFRVRVDSDGELGLDLRLLTDEEGKTEKVTCRSSGAGLTDGKVHHVAVTFSTRRGVPDETKSDWTVTFWVDGDVVGSPSTGQQKRSSIEVQGTQVDFFAGRGLAVPDGAEPQALDTLRILRGTLGRLRFWSRAATKEALFPEHYARWPVFGPPDGLSAQWDFLEQEGRTVTDAIGGNDAVLTSSAPWRLLRDTSTMTVYANGALVAGNQPYEGTLAPATSTGWWLGAPDTSVAGVTGRVGMVTLWGSERAVETIQDQQFTPRWGTERDLLAGWTFAPGGRDITGGDNDIVVPEGRAVPSTMPVTTEGAVVRCVYGGIVTERCRSLADRPAVGSSVDVQRVPGVVPHPVVKRTYVVDADESPDRPIHVGDLGLVWVGQVQTEPTLIGFIEGAPPVPSENLTRPYYLQQSSGLYTRYMNTSVVSLVQQAGDHVSYSSSTNDNGSLDVSAALGIFGTYDKMDLNLIAASTNAYTFKNQVQAQFAFHGRWGTQEGTQYDAAWTAGQRDTVAISGDWEPHQDDHKKYLNPQVGRRYVPDNLGYALVESLTADLYAVTFAATGQALGTVVVPNPAIPPDRNVLMFPMLKQDTLVGCLDGKVGLVDDPSYRGADRRRGSYFKPVQAYALADEITRDAERQRAFAAQLDVRGAGKSGDASLADVPANLPVDVESTPGDDGQVATPRSGLVNRYTWSADGGLHAETQALEVTSTRSFSGFRSLSTGGGIKAGGEFYLKAGFAWSLDLLGTHGVEVSVGSSQGLEQGVSLEVSVEGEAYLPAWDPTATAPDKVSKGAFLPGAGPGKVRQYRFMSIYLPPRARNASAFRAVVDPTWRQLSNDPTARALREIDDSNPVWRVLHRVTYVERVPPPIASRPLFVTSPAEREPVDLAGNAALVALVVAALDPTLPVSRVAVGTAVSTAINPAATAPGVYPTATIERHVSWWQGFLVRARPDTSGATPDPAAAAALADLTKHVVDYVWSGWATGLISRPPVDAGP